MDQLEIDAYYTNYKCVEEQYKKYVLKNFNINSKSSDAILHSQSDNLSFLLSYKAYKTFLKSTMKPQLSLPGLNFTTEQFFWLAISQQWCHVFRNQEVARKTIMSVFPIDSFRVVGPIENNEDFSNDFGCALETEMNPERKCLFGKENKSNASKELSSEATKYNWHVTHITSSTSVKI